MTTLSRYLSRQQSENIKKYGYLSACFPFPFPFIKDRAIIRKDVSELWLWMLQHSQQLGSKKAAACCCVLIVDEDQTILRSPRHFNKTQAQEVPGHWSSEVSPMAMDFFITAEMLVVAGTNRRGGEI